MHEQDHEQGHKQEKKIYFASYLQLGTVLCKIERKKNEKRWVHANFQAHLNSCNSKTALLNSVQI